MITTFSAQFLKPALVATAFGLIGSALIFADEKANSVSNSPGPVYPVKRYESLWKKPLFGRAPGLARASSAEWNLAGVFEIEGKKGAILVNENTGAVENVSLDSPNDSGIQLVTVQPGGKGIPPRVEISQNGETQWVTSRKTDSGLISPNRALVKSRAGEPVPRPPRPQLDGSKSNSQAQANPPQAPQNPAPPSPLDAVPRNP